MLKRDNGIGLIAVAGACIILFLFGLSWSRAQTKYAEASESWRSEPRIQPTVVTRPTHMPLQSPTENRAMLPTPHVQVRELALTGSNSESSQSSALVAEPLFASYGSRDTPVTALTEIGRTAQEMTNHFVAAQVIAPGWYYFEYEEQQPEAEPLTLPGEAALLMSSHMMMQQWLYVDAQNRMQDSVRLYRAYEGPILQTAVIVNGYAVNLTGYENETLRSSAVYSDPAYGADVRALFDITPLLNDPHAHLTGRAWVEDDAGVLRYVIEVRYPADGEPPLQRIFEFDFESGNAIASRAGFFDENNRWHDILVLNNYVFEPVETVPDDIQMLLDKGKLILEAGAEE